MDGGQRVDNNDTSDFSGIFFVSVNHKTKQYKL